MGAVADANYKVYPIPARLAKQYIINNHYSRGCHKAPSACFGLFDRGDLIGACIFATPCSERVRESVFGAEYKCHVTELHRLHLMDCTPKCTETWFLSRCLKMLKSMRPDIWGVVSYSDMTEGHIGTIYRAANAYGIGKTAKARFYLDECQRLRHPRQCGRNISLDEAVSMGWLPVMREAKNRYLWLLPNNKKHRKFLIDTCLYDLGIASWKKEEAQI